MRTKKLEWELLEDDGELILTRARVPGGYLVSVVLRDTTVAAPNPRVNKSTSICFVPDSNETIRPGRVTCDRTEWP